MQNEVEKSLTRLPSNSRKLNNQNQRNNKHSPEQRKNCLTT
jgi:hypothetical protein